MRKGLPLGRLAVEFEKNIDLIPLAETWECSTHPNGRCFIASGSFLGQSLADVLKRHPDFLGTGSKTDGELPILIKLIDARKDLSIQVHPDDDFAEKYENGQLGKTELWYVLDAGKDASVICGLRHTALEAAVLRKSDEPKQPLRVLKYRQGCARELLCRCKYFEVYRMLLNTERCRNLVEYWTDETSFRVLLCVDGCGSMRMEDGDSICFFKGDCIFFPAGSARTRLHGKAQFLDVRG